MSELPKDYGYKDLTPLGRALDENKILREKLEMAKDALIDVLFLIEEHGGRKILAHTTRLSKVTRAINEIEKIK